MSTSKSRKSLAIAVGAALTATLAAAPVAQAEAANPFGLTDLSSGYMLAALASAQDPKPEDAKKDKEGKCGEGKCGEGKKDKEGKCGEGKCGEDKKKDADKKDKEGKCGGAA